MIITNVKEYYEFEKNYDELSHGPYEKYLNFVLKILLIVKQMK